MTIHDIIFPFSHDLSDRMQIPKTTSQTLSLDIGDFLVTHGGEGPPLLLLHGYPQTHVMWHKVIPALLPHFHVIAPDLRGYGDSCKPLSDATYSAYSKREMALDIIHLMQALGYEQFMAVGHDRGARVLHRLLLDHPTAVTRACVMDIAPTYDMFLSTSQEFASGYYHWYFLIQPDELPERMIGADPNYYLSEKLKRWSALRQKEKVKPQPGDSKSPFTAQAYLSYLRSFSDPETIRATCDDYRAAASIDMEHDAEDRESKIECPLLVLWGAKGFIEKMYDVLAIWKARANEVTGHSVDCGHFLPEEAPEEVTEAMLKFFK